MSERKLNINAPLMSVRRGASTTSPSLHESRKKILEKRHTLPHHTNNTDMDQVTEPVAVPFNWEHIPGRRKGSNNGVGSEPQPKKEPSVAPRLPPGKSVTATKQQMEKESKVANSKVRPSNKSNSFNYGSVVKNRIDSEIEKKAETIVEKRSSNMENEKKREKEYEEEKEKEKEEEEDVYSDAVETLSPTESFSMNCSVSGVSGLDTSFDSKKLGTYSTDQQARDFMMSRFLPAAKAMTLQPSQYSSKKQPSALAEQQPRDVAKLVRDEKKPPPNKQITDIVPYASAAQFLEEEESEDEGDVYDNSATNISAKGCGLIPRLHIRNSLCLMNPVPGVKNQVSLPSATEPVKPHKKSHLRSFSPVPAVKKAWEAIHKNKSNSRSSSPDLQEGRKRWTSDSNRFAYFSGELLPGRLSPFRRSRAAAAGVSPCRSKPSSPFRGARIPGDSREAETNHSGKLRFHSGGLAHVQDTLSQGGKRSSYSGNLTIEKTLYIDTASTVKLPSSNLNSVDNRRIDDFVAELNRRRGKESTNSTKESFQDTKHLHALEEKDTLDINSATFYGMLHLKAKEDKYQALTTSQDINREATSFTEEDSEINNQQIVLVEPALSPLPPPLPKSPSESWLWRALPLVSVKNSFQHSNQGTQSHAKLKESNTTSSNIKWETIVKTSNLHHDHVRYSQELTIHKSQHSKS